MAKSKMSNSPVTQQAINKVAKTEQTRSDIATAILSKQLNSEKQQGEPAVRLIEQSAAVASRGIDIEA